jgi:hypothetical protein
MAATAIKTFFIRISLREDFQRGLVRVGADAFGVAARLYARLFAVAIKWRLQQRIRASLWSRGNSRCGYRVIRAKNASQRNRIRGLRSAR